MNDLNSILIEGRVSWAGPRELRIESYRREQEGARHTRVTVRPVTDFAIAVVRDLADGKHSEARVRVVGRLAAGSCFYLVIEAEHIEVRRGHA